MSVWLRAGLLALLVSTGAAAAGSPPAVPYPRDYKTSLVRYAVVDRVDGFSRDLYVSRDALEAVRRDPKLREFPAGALFALDVHRASQTGRERKSGTPIFATSPDGHLVPSEDERTLHLTQKIQPGFGSAPRAARVRVWEVMSRRQGHTFPSAGQSTCCPTLLHSG